MRLNRVRLRGVMAPFRAKEIDVDFSDLRGLIALVGDNGAGKTTILEAPFATLFGRFASRDKPLYDYSAGTDAFLQASFADGEHVYDATLQINAEQRRTECYLSLNGEPIVSGKSGPYQETIEKLFGTRKLALASVLAAQNRKGNFVDMPKGERKAVFMRLLGLERIPELHKRASIHAAAATQVEANLLTIAEQARAAAGKLEEAERELESTREALAIRTKAHAQLEAAVRIAEERSIRVETLASTLGEDPRGLLSRSSDTYRAGVRRLDEARTRARAVLDGEDETRAAIRRLEEIDSEIAECERRIETIESAEKVARQTAERAAGLSQGIDKIRESKERAAEIGALIDEVPCSGVEDADQAGEMLGDSCQLLGRAREARGIARKPIDPEVLRKSEEAHGAAEGADAIVRALPERSEQIFRLRRANNMRGGVERIAGRLEEIERARETLKLDDDARTELDDSWKRLEAETLKLVSKYDETALELDHLPALGTVRQDLSKAKREHAASGTQVDTAEGFMRASERTCDRLRGDAERADEASKMHALASGTAEEWGILRTALSPNGVQALEVANAGPEVAAIANSLLSACYGPRFSIQFETLRDKRDGGVQEVFDVQVFDGQEQRTVEDLSGGEGVIVGEGINLALAIYNARKSGIEWRTLWRDETAGALSPDNAERYVQMLRSALTVGGFEQIIFVAHMPQVWQSADVRLHFEGGEYHVG